MKSITFTDYLLVLLAMSFIFYSPNSGAVDFDVGIDIEYCTDSIGNVYEGYCRAGALVDVYGRVSGNINNGWNWEAVIRHESHPERGDFDVKRRSERSGYVHGIKAGIFYRF